MSYLNKLVLLMLLDLHLVIFIGPYTAACLVNAAYLYILKIIGKFVA